MGNSRRVVHRLLLGLCLVCVVAFTSSTAYAQRIERARPDKGARLRERRLKQGVDEVDKALKQAHNWVDKAISQGKLNHFEQAKDSIGEAYTALRKLQTSNATKDDKETIRLGEEFLETHTWIYQEADSFLVEALAEVEPRSEEYQGDDKEELRKLIRKAWQEQWPDDTIVDIRFHEANWDRTTAKKFNDATKEWDYTDKSVLPVSVYVQQTDNVVTRYPAYVNRDHLNDDALNPGVETKWGGYVTHEVLLSKL